ncbi:MAG TPA: sigma-70 family RNA polymerase sigma factor [Verrucomicrobiae bacterium]
MFKSLFAISDEQAMWRVQTEDDHAAFALLVERWREKIRQLCIRMTGNIHSGEDLAQEVFARVFDKRREFRGASKFSTWLWRIAINRCHDEMRRPASRATTESLDDESSTMVLDINVADVRTPRDSLAAQEEAELVRQALLRLPENYRTVLVLRHYENLKLREIAEVLEVPEGTVSSRMAEALSQLTVLLEPALAQQPKPPRGKELLVV